jgi:hypothetical protein
MRNGAGGQNTDVRPQTPNKATYAGIGFNCNKKGHYASSCPDAEGVQLLQMANIDIDNGDTTYKSAFSFLNVGHQPEECLFTQAAAGHNLIPPAWILLDSQSTVSVFKNRHLLSDIWTSPRTLQDAYGPCEEFWPRLVQPRFPCKHPVHGQSAQGLPHYHGHFRGARHVRAPA